MEVTEDFFGPQVDAAFTGVAMGQFNDGDALRPEKEKQRDEPEPDGNAAIGGNARNDIQVEDGNDKQQHQVPASEDALKVRLVGIGGARQNNSQV